MNNRETIQVFADSIQQGDFENVKFMPASFPSLPEKEFAMEKKKPCSRQLTS